MAISEEYNLINKEAWEPGPWKDEPDRCRYTDSASGLECLIKRHPATGSLNGYVGVGEDHPACSKPYQDMISLDVHGMVTFSGHWSDEANSLYWFGFDCAHAFDYMPNLALPCLSEGSTYRNIDYVKAECANLAEQLAKLAAIIKALSAQMCWPKAY